MTVLNGGLVVERLRSALPPLGDLDHIRARLAIVAAYTGNPERDLPTRTYLRIKRERAKLYGIHVDVWEHDLPERVRTERLAAVVRQYGQQSQYHGVIVQLPLPDDVDTDTVLSAIYPTKDVDALTAQSEFVSPMVQAVGALEDYYDLDFRRAAMRRNAIAVVGQGRLVGKPVTEWLIGRGFEPVVIDIDTPNAEELISAASVIISGTNVPGRINRSNTRPGQIVIDCTGRDLDPAVIEAGYLKAATPARKGGIGPLTVYFLMVNVLKAAGYLR